jgi:hypothetical protein
LRSTQVEVIDQFDQVMTIPLNLNLQARADFADGMFPVHVFGIFHPTAFQPVLSFCHTCAFIPRYVFCQCIWYTSPDYISTRVVMSPLSVLSIPRMRAGSVLVTRLAGNATYFRVAGRAVASGTLTVALANVTGAHPSHACTSNFGLRHAGRMAGQFNNGEYGEYFYVSCISPCRNKTFFVVDYQRHLHRVSKSMCGNIFLTALFIHA